MRTFDFTPLMRSTVGFDRLERMLDSALSVDQSANSYPPYNIETLGEDDYRITMAVAGFGEDDLDVTVKEDTLVITGRIADKTGANAKFLHRGIAGRSFERRFQLADHIKVKGAGLVNGLLHVDLHREIPEEKKPRKIAIERLAGAKQLEGQKAA